MWNSGILSKKQFKWTMSKFKLTMRNSGMTLRNNLNEQSNEKF